MSRVKREGIVAHEYIAETMYQMHSQGKTMAEIGTIFGVTRQGVHQALRKYAKDKGVEPSVSVKRRVLQERQVQMLRERRSNTRYKRLERQKGTRMYVENVQVDAALTGKLLYQMEERVFHYTFMASSAKNKDGVPFPCATRPNSVSFSDREGRVWKLHTWVIEQMGIPRGTHEVIVHKDGDICNNLLENLEVITRRDHGKRVMDKQLATKKSIRQRIYTDAQIRQVRQDYREGIPVSAMCEKYHMAHSTIWAIATYRRYEDVAD